MIVPLAHILTSSVTVTGIPWWSGIGGWLIYSSINMRWHNVTHPQWSSMASDFFYFPGNFKQRTQRLCNCGTLTTRNRVGPFPTTSPTWMTSCRGNPRGVTSQSQPIVSWLYQHAMSPSLREGYDDIERQAIPRRVHQGNGVTVAVAGWEGAVLVGRDLYNVRSVAQAPTCCLWGPAEVRTMGVSFCAARHPVNCGKLLSGGEGPPGLISPGTFLSGGCHHAGPGIYRLSGQAIWPRNRVPNPYRPGKIDGVVHGYRAPCRVLFRVPFPTPEGRPVGYQEVGGAQGRTVPVSSSQGNLTDKCPGVDLSGAVHSHRDGAWSTGM